MIRNIKQSKYSESQSDNNTCRTEQSRNATLKVQLCFRWVDAAFVNGFAALRMQGGQ